MSAANEARLVAKAGFEVLSLEVKVTLRKLTRKAAVSNDGRSGAVHVEVKLAGLVRAAKGEFEVLSLEVKATGSLRPQ